MSQRTPIFVSSPSSAVMSVRQFPCFRWPSRVATKGTSARALPNTFVGGTGPRGSRQGKGG